MKGGFQWRWLLLAVLAVVVVLILRFVGSPEREPRLERPLIQAEVIVPGLEEIPALREVPGKVVATFYATLASKVSGLVESISVNEGDRVGTGSTLIVLDNRDLRAQLQQAQAELDNARDRYQRMQQLFSESLAARQDLENAERSYKVADASRNAIEANLTYTVIKAPFDGVITDKLVEVGELATPGRPLLRMEDDRYMRLEVTVSAADVGALRLGQTVTVRLDAFGAEALPARMAEILPAADPSTHSVTVKADLPRRAGVKSGLFGTMSFPVGSRKALTVPLSAVLQRADLALVYVVNDAGIIQSRFVRLGRIDQDRAEVLSGLDPGETLVAKAREGLDGAQLRRASDAP
jgi:RND family efflux transporter MFP subunit